MLGQLTKLATSCIIDNNGYILAPVPVAPVNEADTVLLPKELKMLKRIANLTGLELNRSYLNLDGGFDSKSNRKVIFNVGMISTIKENPRNRRPLSGVTSGCSIPTSMPYGTEWSEQLCGRANSSAY